MSESRSIPAALEIEELVKAYQRSNDAQRPAALAALSEACEPALRALGERYGAELAQVERVLAETATSYHGGPGHLFGAALARGARERLAKRSLRHTDVEASG